jgi:hypothetical protein
VIQSDTAIQSVVKRCRALHSEMQSDTERCRAMQSDAERCRAMQSDAERCKAMQSDAGRNKAMQGDAIPPMRLPVL